MSTELSSFTNFRNAISHQFVFMVRLTWCRKLYCRKISSKLLQAIKSHFFATPKSFKSIKSLRHALSFFSICLNLCHGTLSYGGRTKLDENLNQFILCSSEILSFFLSQMKKVSHSPRQFSNKNVSLENSGRGKVFFCWVQFVVLRNSNSFLSPDIFYFTNWQSCEL